MPSPTSQLCLLNTAFLPALIGPLIARVKARMKASLVILEAIEDCRRTVICVYNAQSV